MSVFGNEVLLEASTPSEDESSDDSILRQYKEENEMLKKQNEQLRRTVNIFTQPASIKVKDPSKDGPIAHVLLFNNIVARRHCEEIKHFFHSLASRPNGNDDFTLNPPQSSALHYLQPDPTPHRTKRTTREVRKASKAYVVTDSFQIFSEMFYLDQIGEAMTRDEGLESLPPYYERARPDPLDGEVDEIDPTKMNRSSRLCFNCGMKDHQVKDCPSPRNFKNISQRRMQFQGMKGNSPRNEGKSGNSRYHADQDSESNRFSEFKPGIVSPQLREALGIQHHELPTYIYQMRWHGYPPGHMADARINASGLNIFDGNQSD
uniref:Zinc finger CCHC domain-containing protein 8 n=1 Tax=Ciona savignyi TaxID=51511 RepID=H2ZQM0_CIOSA